MDRVGGFGVDVQTDRVVPAEEEEDGAKGRPGQFHQDVAEHECLPGICLGRTFANLVQRSLSDKVRHHLLDQLTENRHQHENTKHLILKTLLRVTGFEKGEADEETLNGQELVETANNNALQENRYHGNVDLPKKRPS